jgi:hypothetical protein
VFDGGSDHIDAKNYFGGIRTNNLRFATTISLSEKKHSAFSENIALNKYDAIFTGPRPKAATQVLV